MDKVRKILKLKKWIEILKSHRNDTKDKTLIEITDFQIEIFERELKILQGYVTLGHLTENIQNYDLQFEDSYDVELSVEEILNKFLIGMDKKKCNCKLFAELIEPIPNKVGYCYFEDRPIDEQDVGTCELDEDNEEGESDE